MPAKQDPQGIGLSELIYRVKQDLLSDELREKDPLPLFRIEQIELEISFTVSRQAEGGINIQVLSLGGGASREDAQTVRVSLAPLVDARVLAEEMDQEDPQRRQQILEQSKKAIFKGPLNEEE